MTARHPLDHSAPRISDLSAEEAKAAMFARDADARAAWLRNRQRRPFADRIANLFRGAPPALGRGDGGHRLPSAVATDQFACPERGRRTGAGKVIG